jgi:hypothetical protein
MWRSFHASKTLRSYCAILLFCCGYVCSTAQTPQQSLTSVNEFAALDTLSQTKTASERRHRLGVGLLHTWGHIQPGNLTIAAVYAYRFHKIIEMEVGFSMMSNPFVGDMVRFNPFDIDRFASMLPRRNGPPYGFFHTGSAMIEAGANITPFASPWDCLYFTLGLALNQWSGYITEGQNLVMHQGQPFVDNRNYYFNMLRLMQFLRVNNRITVTNRFFVDLQLGFYWGQDGISDGSHPVPSGVFGLRLMSIGAVASYSL